MTTTVLPSIVALFALFDAGLKPILKTIKITGPDALLL